ncbi:hypothetical protein ACVWWO_003256 [Bradyrhizobium sp. F1.13.1]
MKAKPHPEQGLPGLSRHSAARRSFRSARIEAALQRGNEIGATTYGRGSLGCRGS